MKYLIEKDKKRRKIFDKKELSLLGFKFLFKRSDLSFKFKKKFFKKFFSFYKNSYSTRIINRCIKTGKRGSVLRSFKISRIEFRRLASFGKICGLRKSSW